jgi:hypothetical protein
MADIIPHNLFFLMMKGEVDLEDDTCYIDLIDDTYTPNADDDTFETGSDPYDSMCGTGNGYTQKTKEVAFTATDDDGNDLAYIDAVDITWTAGGGNLPGTAAYYYTIWDDTATNDPLVYIGDMGANKQAADGADFKIIWDATGVFDMAQA